MTQQNTITNEDSVYKKKLFYDNGKEFTKVESKIINEYKPPTPVTKSHANQTIMSSSGLVQSGTAHYTATLTLLFYSKKEYADWIQYIGAQHKYYDEKGSVYVGIVEGSPDVRTAEMETKYMVSVNFLFIRKQDFEYRYESNFLDTEGHWAEKYITEMQEMGLVTTAWSSDGTDVEYFRPNDPITRAETISLMMRAYRYMDKLLRGF